MDDPFLYGQIAAANALSDVYAMGGEPKLALNLLCVPESMPRQAVHDLLRTELGFDGVAMTDDLAMDAVAAYSEDGAVAVMALQAGNDLVITTDYRTQIPKAMEAVENGTLSTETIDTACRRVLQWKQNLGLL